MSESWRLVLANGRVVELALRSVLGTSDPTECMGRLEITGTTAVCRCPAK